ncbi:MAG: hypothetical protein GXN96_03890 [Aquificae bacterium]|nr:hypothetical protein [Aquificota bacterium]
MSYKEVLLECQKLLAQKDYENLVKKLEELKGLSPDGMSREEIEEVLKILDFLVEEVKKHQEEITRKMINYQRFKGYLR